MKKEQGKGTITSLTRKLTTFAILLALVIVLQVWGGFIKIGATSLSFVLVPIVLGGFILGVWGGTALGLAFGIVTIVQGVLVDPFTSFLFGSSPVMTVLICLVKGGMSGFLPSIVFKMLSRKNIWVATFLAAALAPVANTGVFIIGCYIISDTIAKVAGEGVSVTYFLFIVCAGVNFIVELAINLVLAPAIKRVIEAVNKIAVKGAVNEAADEKAESEELKAPESESGADSDENKE